MVNVYKWPPVAAISREWDIIDPVSTSKSLITGASFASAAQRRRRVATIEVSSRFSPHQSGMGYMKALKRLLAGGIHLVRLDYAQFNWECLDVKQSERAGSFFDWAYPPMPFDWATPPPPSEFRWFDGADLPFTVTTSGGFPAVRVPGLPAQALVALPGEFVTIFADEEDMVGMAFMILTPTYTDDAGVAIIKLVDTPVSGDRVSIGGKDAGVFRALSMPRTMEPAGGDWSYVWEFEEVFDDEGRGPFTEVNPWI